MISVHDNEIISYEVDLQGKLIRIFTSYATKKYTIIFSDVFAHYFENELFGSIILDIEKYGVQEFVDDNYKLFEQRKKYCWPMDYDTIPELIDYIKSKQYIYYYISPSYGLGGWVLAKRMDVTEE